MIRPVFLMDASGLPLIRPAKIEEWCARILRAFDPALELAPGRADLAALAEQAVGFTIAHESLSSNGSILGMTIFTAREDVIVFDPEAGRACYRAFPGNTILLDRGLEGAAHRHRYRFTLAHELGHAIWHRAWFERAQQAFAACEEGAIGPERAAGASPMQRLEAQANRTASCLLMPRRAVENHTMRALGHAPRSYTERRILAFEMASLFDVSPRAAMIRLEDVFRGQV